ncbi:MAG: PAS domain S-box protein, partial [Leptothrix sp. (in: b-proteobacteria)]
NHSICTALAGRYQVETVSDGHHGLALALAWYPDLIVLDRVVPTLGAEELVHALRARPGLERTPILVIGALADAAPDLLAPLAGVQDQLARPFQVEDLLVRVGTQLAIQGAAQALRRSEEQWRELFEHASDGIFIADLTGRYTDINQAGCVLLGRSRDELIGRTIIDLIPPADVARLQQVRDRLIAGAHDIGEWRLLHKNGQHVAVEVSTRILSDGRWLGIVRDITARKLVADELEMRVRERTEQLRTLASELEAAENRERRQIARDLHDDLGQTLAAARIRLSPLCEDACDDVRAAAQGIDALIERANRATRSLATQLAPAVLHELGLGPAIEWLCDEIHRTYGLNVLIADDGQPKPISPEAGSILYRAVRELLINVARHAGTDRAEIEMLREGDHIVVRVSDSGVGFDTGQLDARTPHTGLGLLSVRERLSFIGGTAEVCSVPGDGTVAELSAPLVRDRPQAAPGWEVCT